MKKYSAKLHLTVEVSEQYLEIKSGVECENLPPQITEIMSELLVKIPLMVREGWLIIEDKYPETANGFTTILTFHFGNEEDNWAISAKSYNPNTVDDMLLGMAKMIFQGDPIVDEIINSSLNKLDFPEGYVQHFDPTC